MKISIIAVLVMAASSFAAQADQFSAANSDLSNAIADNAMHQDAGTQQRVHDAYSRAKLAASNDSGEAISHKQSTAHATISTLTDADGKSLTRMNAQRTHQQVVAGGLAEVNAQIEAAAQAQGEDLTKMNTQRTRQQIVAGGIAEVNAQMQAALEAQQIANYGVKVNSAGVPANIISASTLTAAKAPVTINVAASTLTPSTPVSVTVNGVTQTVAASTLAPSVQVTVPQTVSYFAGVTPHTANGGRDSVGNRSEHGTGNGSNNAANSNSAHGLGGGNHIGGGSAQSGSRNIGHW